MIRITGGKFKQKKLASINDFVRPTSSLKREAFFSIIESYAIKNSIELYKNKIFLDLFAGIGTMGLEAISRGMSEVIFFENNIEVLKILRKNSLSICKSNNLFNDITANDQFYFVHSYFFDIKHKKNIICNTQYGINIPAIVNQENIFGFQFHPEKSGRSGLKILYNWLKLS